MGRVVVLVLERVSPGLRGELTRWMLEVHAGVFVGKLSALVRDRIWAAVTGKLSRGSGAGILVYSAPSEQGFALRYFGVASRSAEDFEGLTLMRTPLD